MPNPTAEPLRLLSIIIPARDEAGCISSTVEHLHVELRLRSVPHEIIVVDDGSSDATWEKLLDSRERVPALKPLQNTGQNGFGRAITFGLDRMNGDAAVIMMADESDDCRDVVRYWELLNQGWDAVFGSRFMKGGGVIDYPWIKLRMNRLANLFIRVMFGTRLNDSDECVQGLSRHGDRRMPSDSFAAFQFDGGAAAENDRSRLYSWTVIPITWRNRRTGKAKLD